MPSPWNEPWWKWRNYFDLAAFEDQVGRVPRSAYREETMSRDRRKPMSKLGLMGRERDFQRQRCYDSENEVRHKMPNNPRYEKVAEIEQYVDALFKKSWFKRRWGSTRVPSVHDGRGYVNACSYGGMIVLPRWARTRLVILHELAHEVTPTSAGGGHGRYWACAFLELVYYEMGEEAYKILRDSFKKNGVKYTMKRQMNREQKQKAQERGRALYEEHIKKSGTSFP